MANGEQPLFGRRFTIISAIIVVLGLIYLVLRSDPELRPKLYPPEPVASGLTNPRALAFGADGLLYVAEAGYGGRTSRPSKPDYDGGPARGDRDGPAVEPRAWSAAPGRA